MPAGLAWAPNGNLLVALSTNNTLSVIDRATNTVVKQIPVGNVPNVVRHKRQGLRQQPGRPSGANR